MPAYRSRVSTHGRTLAGARALWRATGVRDSDFGRPIIAVVNSYTRFVPGHVHLRDLGDVVAEQVRAAGGIPRESHTIAIDDGIATGQSAMLYSLPSRDLIADSVEHMVNARAADTMVCISNCDRITPGMLMAVLRPDIPAIFVSGCPMEAGTVAWRGRTRAVDLIDAMAEALLAAAHDAGVDFTMADIDRLSRQVPHLAKVAPSTRQSGGTAGLSMGHVSPEAAAGGGIGLVEDGDRVVIDIPNRTIHLDVSDEELAARRAAMLARGARSWTPGDRSRPVSAALRAYAAMATSADMGAVRDVDRLDAPSRVPAHG